MRAAWWSLSLFVLGCTAPSSAPTPAEDLPEPRATTPDKTAPDETGPPGPSRERVADPGPPLHARNGPPNMEGDCIGAHASDKASGPGPSIARWTDIELDRLAAAIPPKIGNLKAGDIGKWERGMAGHASPNVVTVFTGPSEEHHLLIYDMQHRCSCSEGMGLRRRDLEAASQGGSKTTVAQSPALLRQIEGGGTAQAWVADRCHVSVSSPDVERAKRVLEALDFNALGAVCADRSLARIRVGVQ